MRILQVTPFFSPIHGGSAEVPYQLCRELIKRRHEITVYTSDYKLSPEYVDCIPEVKVRVFKASLKLAKFFVTPGMVKQARNEIRYFDVLHMHNYRTLQNIVVHHYARKYNIPYVLQAHGSLTTFFQKGWLKKTFDAIWGYRILRDASKVIAATEPEAEQYRSMGTSEDKIEIVPYGIDLSEFEDLPQRGEFRRKWGIDDSLRIVLYLARIDKIKGADLLAEAFTELSKGIDNVKLVIVGPDDGYLPSLKKLIADLEISDKVLFTGPLYEQEKLKAYVDADVYVLASVYEIFGITVLEALACGTPVVVTDRCGIVEWIGNNTGYVVQYDKQQLREAIFKILTDEESRQQFGEERKKLITEQFTWGKIIGLIERVYLTCSEGEKQ